MEDEDKNSGKDRIRNEGQKRDSVWNWNVKQKYKQTEKYDSERNADGIYQNVLETNIKVTRL